MRVKYWGVRGSLPSAPRPEQNIEDAERIMQRFFLLGFSKASDIPAFFSSQNIRDLGGYGTATISVEVKSSSGGQLIIDGGSGLRHLSEHMMRGAAGEGTAEIHIFMTHFHWDHLIGLPFFAPHFISGNKIHYYAVQPELPTMVKNLFRRPNFPVDFQSLSASIDFHQLEPRKLFILGDFKITPYQLDHPDPCWGYRIENQGRVYSHCIDTEGTRFTHEALGLDLPLYQGVDLMCFDAQYTLPELVEKANWGHSAAQIGLDIGFRENIKRILFAHHDPGAQTQRIRSLEKQVRDYYQWKVRQAEINHSILPKVEWEFVYEGLEVEV